MAGTKHENETQAGPIKIQNFINGKFVDPASGKHIESCNPSTGKVHVLVPSSDKRDVEEAVQAAHAAFPAWSGLTKADRASIMNKVADLMQEEFDAFAEAESADQGKPLHISRGMDIPRSIENFRFFGEHIQHLENKCTEIDRPYHLLSYTRREPIGVAGLISPWNFPLYLLTWKIAPCIAVGNTCVCKPSELASYTAFKLAQILNKAGVPPGVVNLVFGEGGSTGSAIVEHPLVPVISFTGGSVTGARINSAAAPMFKKVSLEMGGKNAGIVFADADLERAIADTIKSGFTNNGQVCLCTSRILVQRPIYDQFVERYVTAAKNLHVGHPTDPKTNVSAVNSLAHMQKVLSYIELAKKEGGHIHCGGQRAKISGDEYKDGYFIEPTVITGLGPKTRCMQEEIFGPVVAIAPFDTDEEGIAWANNTEFGLSAAVWTQNVTRAHKISARLQAGTVWINCWFARDLSMPFGGYKKSGVGREGWPYSLDVFTEEKAVCLRLD